MKSMKDLIERDGWNVYPNIRGIHMIHVKSERTLSIQWDDMNYGNFKGDMNDLMDLTSDDKDTTIEIAAWGASCVDWYRLTEWDDVMVTTVSGILEIAEKIETGEILEHHLDMEDKYVAWLSFGE